MSLLLVCGGVFTAVTYGGDTDVKSGEEEQIDEKYITHEMTESEIKELKKDVGVKDPDKDYNEIVDGHGTGWAPPSEEDYGSMKGSTFVDDVSSDKDDLRASRDLTTKKYFPPVGNQGSQGSCAAWATGYYTNTFAQARAYDYDASSGNDEYRMSPAWIYNHVNGGEDSGATLEGCSEHVDTVGSSNWANMPYDQYDHTSWGSESAWRNAPKYRTSEFIKTHVSNTDVIKSWVNSSKLVSFAMDSNQYDWSDDDILSSQEYDAGNP
ncbi:MAG: hypothetical protein KGY76_03665, partial [Candidatus Thermoplasmatota archaeon]|nr:hypothetical protein [Candidatus Thermoplasmatota archaeon]